MGRPQARHSQIVKEARPASTGQIVEDPLRQFSCRLLRGRLASSDAHSNRPYREHPQIVTNRAVTRPRAITTSGSTSGLCSSVLERRLPGRDFVRYDIVGFKSSNCPVDQGSVTVFQPVVMLGVVPVDSEFPTGFANSQRKPWGVLGQRQRPGHREPCPGLLFCLKQIIAAYVEVDSGKIADRPELVKALAHAKRSKATLCVAKLDRLARNVEFLARVMNSNAEFFACENPAANRLTLHILAAVAEAEAKAIGDRTKAALAAAKKRGINAQGQTTRRGRSWNAVQWPG